MTESLIGARRTVLVALISVASLLFAGQASQARVADLGASSPDKITFDVKTVMGSGCEPGTDRVTVSSDKTSLRVSFKDFVAEVGPSADATDFRKNCQINLLVHIPQGFTFAIARAEYNGRVNLAAGATAVHHAYYYWQGESETAHSAGKRFTGPINSTWNNIDVTPVAELVYAPCGESRNLNINTDLRVNAGTSSPYATSAISMRHLEGDVDTIYHVDWKTC
jgi:hypothetical protein